ncbi:MAG: DUF2924 domain-containing protein [Bradyrhizobium sp.]|uniref:DUF2924 domain-containing protein n=1 Tax=Hyphomicrobiales TaxID=356 RepID=UPI002730BA5D|nr:MULTISPECIES: DUF2924 domain-containing protein [Hyphomicrobiales]MDP1868928.1 DUF2924 domain-containing protein [Bradyrhizobium sp.]MDP2372636.1 DUF2924 domain-containing protein [Reyranella sp.]
MRSAYNGTLEVEIVRLNDLSLGELRRVWKERLDTPPAVTSTELMRRWLSWELQAQAKGGFDAATRRRLRQLSKAFRALPPSKTLLDTSPRPGSMLTREWNGVIHRVMVLEEGFAWNGQKLDSLSEIAFRITGTRWSGPRFFGLR